MLPEHPNWELTLVDKDFLRSYPGVTRDSLEESLHRSQFIDSALNNNHWLPGMGTTFHGALPVGLRIPGLAIPELSVLCKKVEEYVVAELEFTNSQILRKRGVNLPQMLAVLMVDDNGIILSKLMHTALPLSARDLEYRRHHPSIYKPQELVEDFVSAIADQHNKGGVHGDLHLGNLGHEFINGRPPKVVFFDFETGTVLSNNDLAMKNQGLSLDLRQSAKFQRFEIDAIHDLGFFTASLRHAGLPLKRGALLDLTAEVYSSHRTESLGIIRNSRLRTSLANSHNQFRTQLRQRSQATWCSSNS